MTTPQEFVPRSVPLQLVLGLIGATAFCIYSRSWKDAPHLIYDIPAGLVVYVFVAQLLLEVVYGGWTWYWGARLALLVAMAVVTTGREFQGWTISGHLSCVLAVALVQAADPRLAVAERIVYWLPLPIVLYIRWYIFDLGAHWQTYNAVLFAVLGAAPVMVMARMILGK